MDHALSCPDRRRLLLALLAASGAVPAQASEEEDGATRIKAAFLFRMAGYVEWPPGSFSGPDAAFVIGVQGSEAMYAELLNVLEGRRVQERAVQLRRVRGGEALAGLHLLFVASTGVLPAPPPRALLLVAEEEGALGRGASVNFLLVERRVRFEIALSAAERAGLRLSSRLLAVAHRVLPAGAG